MHKHYIIGLHENHLPLSAGNKARNLRALIDRGFPVPRAHVLSWAAYQQYEQNNTAIIPLIQQALNQIIRPGQLYAVRSSANVEDSLLHSFAGQFKSALNVCGADDVFRSIWAIWATAASEHVQVYLQKLPPDQRDLKMAVIIQEMVTPVISGVAFSKNPITGLDEIVIEAVPGTGEALVQAGSTPNRWIFKWGQWISRPENSPIPEDVVEKVVTLVQKVAEAFKRDVDLEWVYDGDQVHLVQMRDITTIGGVNIYSNAISKDMIPGPIKPLIWTTNIPLMTGQIGAFMVEMLGLTSIDPAILVKPYYYRAYFNMTALGQIFSRIGLPAESLEMMMGVGPGGARMPKVKMHRKMVMLLPRLGKVMWEKLHFSARVEREYPQLEAESRAVSIEKAASLSKTDLLSEIDHIYHLMQRLAYLNFVSQILMYIYTGILRGHFKKSGLDFEQFDLMHGSSEIEQFDPVIHLSRLSHVYNQYDQPVREKIRACSYAEFCALSGIEPFQQAVAGYLRRFGHLSDSGNDFSMVPWRENPDLILQTITASQDSPKKASAEAYTFEQARLPALARFMLTGVYRRARQFRLYREQIGFLYTYVYGLFRVYYLALAKFFVQRGLLAAPEDIFYLATDEVRAQVVQEEDWRARVAQRREEMACLGAVPLPTIIYGDQAPPVVGLSDHRLTGTPTSRGCFTGPVRVVRGIQDFTKVQNGDVLVVPFSDVGWTPLFARAGGVVAESGGMLSHSSIIAREYQIPAVVSVAGALQLEDNTVVTVDGFKGEVLIHVGDGASFAPTG